MSPETCVRLLLLQKALACEGVDQAGQLLLPQDRAGAPVQSRCLAHSAPQQLLGCRSVRASCSAVGVKAGIDRAAQLPCGVQGGQVGSGGVGLGICNPQAAVLETQLG